METDSWERARQVLEAAGLPPARLAGLRPLSGGTYNTVEELVLTDGSRYVLKVPPPRPPPACVTNAGFSCPRRSSTARRPRRTYRCRGSWQPAPIC